MAAHDPVSNSKPAAAKGIAVLSTRAALERQLAEYGALQRCVVQGIDLDGFDFCEGHHTGSVS